MCSEWLLLDIQEELLINFWTNTHFENNKMFRENDCRDQKNKRAVEKRNGLLRKMKKL